MSLEKDIQPSQVFVNTVHDKLCAKAIYEPWKSKNVYPDKEPNKAPGGRGWGVFEKEKLPVCSQGNRVSFLLGAAPGGGGGAGPGGGEAGPGGGVGTTFSLLHCIRTASESANVCCRSASFIRSPPGPDGLRIPVPMLPRDRLMDQDPKHNVGRICPGPRQMDSSGQGLVH